MSVYEEYGAFHNVFVHSFSALKSIYNVFHLQHRREAAKAAAAAAKQEDGEGEEEGRASIPGLTCSKRH